MFYLVQMKYLNNKHYIDVKDKTSISRPDANNLLQEPKPPKSLITQNQVIKETKSRKNQKDIQKDNDELELEN